MWLNWITAILGIWLIVSSFIPALCSRTNLLIVGVAVAALGFWTALTLSKK